MLQINRFVKKNIDAFGVEIFLRTHKNLCNFSHIRTHTLTNDDSPLSTLLNKVDSHSLVASMTPSKKGFDCPLCNKKAFASAEVSLILIYHTTLFILISAHPSSCYPMTHPADRKDHNLLTVIYLGNLFYIKLYISFNCLFNQ